MITLKVGIHFPPQKVDKPVISALVREYNLMFNILSASVSPGKRGKAILEMIGEEAEIASGIEFLKAQGVDCFVLTDNVIILEDKCVQCGACTSVCPSDALSMDKNGMLKLDEEKCILCGHCTRACPTRALLKHEDVMNGD